MEFQQEVLQRLTAIETKLSNGISKKQDDHEHRLRFLERGFYIAFGGLAVLQLALRFYSSDLGERHIARTC